jgi:hypothetical protein
VTAIVGQQQLVVDRSAGFCMAWSSVLSSEIRWGKNDSGFRWGKINAHCRGEVLLLQDEAVPSN